MEDLATVWASPAVAAQQQSMEDLTTKWASPAVAAQHYLGGHEHLPVKAHLSTKELGPEMLAWRPQT